MILLVVISDVQVVQSKGGPFFLGETVYVTLVTAKKLPFFWCVDFIVCMYFGTRWQGLEYTTIMHKQRDNDDG